MIAALFARAWARIWPYVAAAGAIIVAAFTIRQSGKRQGKQQAEREQADAISEQRKKTNDVDTKMAQMDDDGVRRELRQWVRPTDAEDR